MIPAFTTQTGAQFAQSLGPAAWFRYGVGITSSLGAVSQWDDQSGNGRHLKQATGTNQPAVQADNSILFDGADNFMACDAFTFNQPETIYLLGKQVSWTGLDRIFDGNTSATGMIRQVTASPQVAVNAGASLANSSDWTVDTYAVIATVFNSTSSSFQVNKGTVISGDAGTNNMGGFYLGSQGGGAGAWSNIQVKEVILYAAAHSAATRTRVISYLMSLGGL